MRLSFSIAGIFLLVLGFLGISIGSAVTFSSYLGRKNVESCIANASCYSKLGLFRSLSIQSSLRAQFDVGIILAVISSIMIVYILLNSTRMKDRFLTKRDGNYFMEFNSSSEKDVTA